MGKYKKLLKNISLLTISNFSSKILSFLLVPLYTGVLSTGDFGTFDLYQTTITLLIPILSLNISDAVLRFSLDSVNDKRKVYTIGLQKIAVGSLVLCIAVLINSLFKIVPIFNEYPVILFLMFFLVLLHNLLTQFAQGCEKIFHLAVAGIISSVILLATNLLFLLVFKLGLKGYFYAFCISYIAPIIYLLFTLNTSKYTLLRHNDKKLSKAMTSYSKPLILNTISWWIINVSDRYIVTFMCGISANGIYSVSGKIPAILVALQTIFSQAWTISSVDAYKDKDDAFFSKMYAVYNALMTVLCSVLIVFSKLIAKLLFAKEFYTAWKYSSFLLISIVFSSMSILLGGVFTASKNTKLYTQTTIIGTLVNIVLNFILIDKIGVVGAAVATLISFAVIWAIRLFAVNKKIKLKIKLFRDIASYIILITQAAVLYCVSNSAVLYSVQAACALIICLLYYKDVASYIKTVVIKIKTKMHKNQ